ncbi:hypothetical protein [Streptomyces sp. NBC_01304]|uniref:hypothetical protein n=1 Tax=Streptomyces sp. NBC_01304 TaxID=2903818 RepID=UPI002E0FA5B0|nr:hypothetical protein OG430_43190 [Streptomyces sp. NBC_01304]
MAQTTGPVGAWKPDAGGATPERDAGGATPEPDKVHRRQRILVLVALATAVPGLLLGGFSYFGAVHILVAPWIALPLVTRQPRRFRSICLVTGLALIVVGVLGLLLGLFVYVPAALVLLCATADPRSSRVRSRIAVGVAGGVAALIAVLVGWVLWSVTLRDTHTFRAELDADGAAAQANGVGPPPPPYDYRLDTIGHGASNVYVLSSDAGSFLHVTYPESMSEAKQDQLERFLADLPGVAHVEQCSPSDC